MNNKQEKNNIPHGVHIVHKKVGETPLQCILRFQNDFPKYKETPMTYAGRLDPMASGLLVLLSGDAVHQKEEYIGLSKTYQFDILWGVTTDTLDTLGLVVDTSDMVPTVAEVVRVLDTSVGECEQQYPVYSSKPVLGKPLFQWAREGRLSEIQIPGHKVEIEQVQFVSRLEISAGDVLQKITEDIGLLSGDFRQDAIVTKWQEVLEDRNKSFFVDTVTVSVSSGFYVRQFVADIAKELSAVATTYAIHRTRVGDFVEL